MKKNFPSQFPRASRCPSLRLPPRSSPLAAPLSTCFEAGSQTTLDESSFFCYLNEFAKTALSSLEQRHSSGSALPLHLLPGGGANGQQGRQQHPRFLNKSQNFLFVNFLLLSGSGSDISRAATFGSASESSTPFISPQGTPIPFNRFAFNSMSWIQSNFILRSRHNSAQGRLCRSR